MTDAGTPEHSALPGDLPAGAYRRMAGVLRAGLLLSVAIMVVSLAVLLDRSGGTVAASWVSNNPLRHDIDPRALWAELAGGNPEGYLTLGVYALVATPVVRVVTGIREFALHRERRMVLVSTAVLGMLLVGLLVVGPLVR